MITEFLIGVGVAIANWIATLFPQDWEPPTFITELDTTVNSVIANVDGMAVWADWAYILAVVGVVVLVWGIGLSIKLARAVAAHIPFFGGAG